MNARVLVVEDDEPFASLLQRVLGRHGFTVTVAYTLADALELLDTAPARSLVAILLDLHLPDGEGQELLDSMRVAASGVPVIPMSGWADVPGVICKTDTDALVAVAKACLAPALDRLSDTLQLRVATR